MAKKVIILSRVSTDTQTLGSQTDKVMSEVLKYYSEDEIIIIENKESAVKKSEEELLGINEMKNYIDSYNIETVYCYELSRLSRRPKVLYSLRDYFLEHKVQLIVLNPYFKLLNEDNSLNESSNVIFALYATFAENEARQLKERCIRGKQKKKQEGKFVGGRVLFGYSKDENKNFIINEANAAIVREIFQLYVGGETKLNICRIMRNRGYLLTYQSTIDSHQFVDNLLHNRDYCGLNGKPRIISDELFEMVQNISPKKKRRIKTKRIALGRSFLYNPLCSIKRKYYYVNTKINAYFSYFGKEKDHPYFINLNIVDNLIWYVVKKHYQRLSTVFENLDSDKTSYNRNNLITKMSQLREEINELNNSIQRIEERVVFGKLSMEKANQLESMIEKQIEQKQEQINEVSKSLENIKEIVSDNIDELNEDEKCSLVRKIFFDIHMWREEKFYWYLDFYLDSETVERYQIYTKGIHYYIKENNEWVRLEV